MGKSGGMTLFIGDRQSATKGKEETETILTVVIGYHHRDDPGPDPHSDQISSKHAMGGESGVSYHGMGANHSKHVCW